MGTTGGGPPGDLVRKEGLEPTCLSALEPKSSASTNSATFAVDELYPKRRLSPEAGGGPRGRYNAQKSSASALPLPVDHYENFPVASWLLPARLRPPVEAIYAFARGADDIADEGELSDAARLRGLERYSRALDAIEAGDTPTEAPFARLAAAVRDYDLPIPLLRDLIDAFSQDVVKKRYATFDELADYARRSANPVGRLLIHIFENEKRTRYVSGKPGTDHSFRFSTAQSDLICSALQYVNFWQDVEIDWAKGRVYIPREDLERFGVDERQIEEKRVDSRWTALMRFQCERARAMLVEGKPLGRALPGRVGLEIRATVEGGIAIADRIVAAEGDVFRHRPRLRKRDWARILAKALVP